MNYRTMTSTELDRLAKEMEHKYNKGLYDNSISLEEVAEARIMMMEYRTAAMFARSEGR